MKSSRDLPQKLARARDNRKRQGVFYTPEPVASYLAAATCAHCQATPQSLATLRVIDPACGAGALLWPVYQRLCQQLTASDGRGRLEIVRRQLFGVDLDPQAVETLRQRFRLDLASQVAASILEPVLDANFRCGNTISGHGWEGVEANAHDSRGDVFHWSQAFPEICAAGGFDVVLANPPYRRERGAKLDLAGLEQAPLASRWRRARMDLWHYFLHRSLDLLRPGGLLVFIVNSYWTTSHAGRTLIERLSAETTPLEFVILDKAPVFAGVAGRHLIMMLRKGVTSEPCDIFRLQETFHSTVGSQELWTELLTTRNAIPSSFAAGPFTHHRVARDELFHDGRMCLEPRPTMRFGASRSIQNSSRRLGELFEVRQGIAENPPRVTRKQSLAQPEYGSGEGVFVLTTDELQQLKLSAAEEYCVRPYYSATEISRYWSPPVATHWLLYVTRHTVPDLADFQKIAEHLSRFRPLLERRRETQQGKIPWWHLHWPRQEQLFELPRILAVQMCREPRFAYVESPTYVGFSTNLIVSKSRAPEVESAGSLSLPALAAVLSSAFATQWFTANAKLRGVNLDITGSTLKDFPIIEFEPSDLKVLLRLSHERRELERLAWSVDAVTRKSQIELEIDKLVSQSYLG